MSEPQQQPPVLCFARTSPGPRARYTTPGTTHPTYHACSSQRSHHTTSRNTSHYTHHTQKHRPTHAHTLTRHMAHNLHHCVPCTAPHVHCTIKYTTRTVHNEITDTTHSAHTHRACNKHHTHTHARRVDHAPHLVCIHPLTPHTFAHVHFPHQAYSASRVHCKNTSTPRNIQAPLACTRIPCTAQTKHHTATPSPHHAHTTPLVHRRSHLFHHTTHINTN